MSHKSIHVVAAVIRDNRRNIFIAKRFDGKHQGGKWEFPGGKVEQGEIPVEALKRELFEEIGIQVTECQALIQINHQYPEKTILLDVWEVTGFTGEAYGKEGQPVKWIAESELGNYTFPEANLPIITAATLPTQYLITPDPSRQKNFLQNLERTIQVNNIGLLQFRAKQLSANEYMELAPTVIDIAQDLQCKVMLNSPPEWIDEADGLHLTSLQLASCEQKAEGKWLSASCHSLEELQLAKTQGVDFALLSPVNRTASHPEFAGMGWEQFQQQVFNVEIPVYALGGVAIEDIATARNHGAQGIAAISALWKELYR